MECPSCGKEMSMRPCYTYNNNAKKIVIPCYMCECGTKCVDGTFIIPDKYKAPKKLINIAKWIAYELYVTDHVELTLPPNTGKEIKKFIGAYLDAAREASLYRVCNVAEVYKDDYDNFGYQIFIPGNKNDRPFIFNKIY